MHIDHFSGFDRLLRLCFMSWSSGWARTNLKPD
ncbi:hypothetical protein [Mesorhizobium sp. M0768]